MFVNISSKKREKILNINIFDKILGQNWCLFWSAKGRFACCLVVKIIFLALQHLIPSQIKKQKKKSKKKGKNA